MIATYDESTSHVLFALMETLMLQSADDETRRAEARRLGWECLRDWSTKLDRSVHSLGNLAFEVGDDAETFWRKHDLVVLIARLKVRAENFRKWSGAEPAD